MMIDVGNERIARRRMLAGMGATGLMLLMPGWAVAATGPSVDVERLNRTAEAGARRAGQVARGTTGLIKREDAAAVISGEATAGTSLLRTRVGPRLINVMIPALERELRADRDPVVMAAVSRLSGVELNDVAKAIALKADSAIWYQIGAEEGDIRTNPQSTGDRGLIAAFKRA